MVFGINPRKMGADATRGALDEVRRQGKAVLGDLNPMKYLRGKKRKVRKMLSKYIPGLKGKGRPGRPRRPPPIFYRGNGGRRRGGRRRLRR